MLLGEQLRRRHHRRLEASFGCACSRERGDDRLAAPDVALHEPQHRARLREIALDLLPRTQLRARQVERQRVREARDERLRAAALQRPARIALNLATEQPQAQLMREQLFEREPALHRMAADREQLGIRIRRRTMHELERVAQRRQLQRLEHRRRNPVAHRSI